MNLDSFAFPKDGQGTESITMTHDEAFKNHHQGRSACPAAAYRDMCFHGWKCMSMNWIQYQKLCLKSQSLNPSSQILSGMRTSHLVSTDYLKWSKNFLWVPRNLRHTLITAYVSGFPMRRIAWNVMFHGTPSSTKTLFTVST